MTPSLTTRLAEIKDKCRKVIALGEQATKGPWHKVKTHWPGQLDRFHVCGDKGHGGSSNIRDHSVASCGPEGEQDASFIAASRNLTPALANGLLVALEALQFDTTGNHNALAAIAEAFNEI